VTSRPNMTDAALQMMLSMLEQPMHGYAIKLAVEERTGGAVRLGSGTLYEGLQRLEEWGWIEEVAADSTDAKARRFYGLTAAGRIALKAELERLESIVAYARRRDLLGSGGGAP